MQTLKATVQAGVPHMPVAAAIAGQLIQHIGNLGRIHVDRFLPGILEHGPGQLAARQKGWQFRHREPALSAW